MNPWMWIHLFCNYTISCRLNDKYIDIVFGIDNEPVFGYNIIQKHVNLLVQESNGKGIVTVTRKMGLRMK